MELLRPSSLEDAASALAQSGAKAIAGGTALQLTWEAGAQKPDMLVDVSRIADLEGKTFRDEDLIVGALTPISGLIEDQTIGRHVPLLALAAKDVGGPTVRRMGTLGGQIGWGTGCLLPALLALDAQVLWHGPDVAGQTALVAYLASHHGT